MWSRLLSKVLANKPHIEQASSEIYSGKFRNSIKSVVTPPINITELSNLIK